MSKSRRTAKWICVWLLLAGTSQAHAHPTGTAVQPAVATAVTDELLPLADELVAYVVTELTGEVLTRAANGGRWLKLQRGQRLANGQLVQVTTGAAVTLKQKLHASSPLNADQAILIISSPLLFRVGEATMRQMQLSRHLIDRMPHIAAKARKAALKTTAMRLDEAWHKMAAVFTNQDGATTPEDAEISELERLGMAMGVASKNLRLLTPAANSQILVDSFPADLNLGWASSGLTPFECEVFFWPARKARGAPLGLTKDDHFTVTLTAPGTYFAQISAKNGSWQSQAHLLNVKLAEPQVASSQPKAERRTAPKSAADSRFAVVDFPPAAYEVRQRAGAAPVVYYWHSKPQVVVRRAEVVLQAADGRELQRLEASSGQTLPLGLPVGAYQWHMHFIVGSEEPLTDEQTPNRDLVVVSDPGPLASGLVKNVLAPGVSGVYMLSDGL